MLENRRTFIQATATAAAFSRSILGANDRVQMAIIGTGGRGTLVHSGFTSHDDQVFVAACDVAGDRLDQFVTKSGGKMATFTDYRKVLDLKDVDAVLITTPDHWHAPIMIDAVAAGKDVYVEKPISNTIEPAQKMVEAVHKSDRIVQVGIQQRSWNHFQEAIKLLHGGLLGEITHSQNYYANYMRPPVVDPPQPVPDGLDWDMFQGPAKRHPYAPTRQRSWRSYYDYGGGMITDWGVHLVDTAHWGMQADNKIARMTSSSSSYLKTPNPDMEQTPPAFAITWEYDDFIMTFDNLELPNFAESNFPLWGTYFYGQKGVMLINRLGYKIIPKPARGGGPAIEAKSYLNPKGWRGDSTPEHARNFLDCVKSRQQPICPIDIGYHSSMPCIIALLSIRNRRQYAWDAAANTAKPA